MRRAPNNSGWAELGRLKRVTAPVPRSAPPDQAVLPSDWLNDAVKGLMLGADVAATVVYASEGLTVSVASPGYLFAMKAAAARVERDAGDLKTLYGLNGFENAQEALDLIERSFRQRDCCRKPSFSSKASPPKRNSNLDNGPRNRLSSVSRLCYLCF